jgi:hypothetical protein
MADSHVITALVKKRAELAGRIEHLQDRLRQAVIDLDNVDATIHLFDPTVELAEIKARPVPPRHHAFRGEVSRIVLTTLRNAKRPLTTAEIAQRVMAERGLDTANTRLLKVIAKRTGACLRDQRKRGVVRSEVGTEGLLIWKVIP